MSLCLAPTQPLTDWPCTVLSNTAAGPGLFLLTLQLKSPVRLSSNRPQGTFACQPGQFVMLAVEETGTWFRRPFSLLRFNKAAQTVTIYYKVMGPGTQKMSQWQPGQTTQLLSPLGVGFEEVGQPALTASPEQTLLIGGGIGIAPLFFQAQQWINESQPTKPLCLFGARTAAELSLAAELDPLCSELLLATDDGSLGQTGTVITLLNQQKEALQAKKIKRTLVCGPNPMMAAVVRWFEAHLPAVEVVVSLENHMPCGTGACFGCVVSQAGDLPPIKVCQSGPAFVARQLAWGETGPC